MKDHNKLIYYYVIFIALIIFYLLRFTTIFDENYSLVLVNHNFSNVVKFDILDVHPPLFYLLLKFFLQLTTFWTTSLLIKIIFARIFILLISMITVIILIKMLCLFNIKQRLIVSLVLFLLIPGVITFTFELIKIRMYSLCALFVVLELYCLLKYTDLNRKRYLFFTIIICILSEYTNYYSAVVSGVILIVCFIQYIIKMDKRWPFILLSGLLMALAFSFWVPNLLKQFSLQQYHPLPAGIFKQWIATLFFILIFIYPLIYSIKYMNYKFNLMYLNVSITLFILFIFMSMITIVYRPVFQFRYIYPIFLVYSFISLNIIIKILNTSKLIKVISISILSFLLLITIGAYVNQTYNSIFSSISLIRQIHKLGYNHKRIIYLNSKNSLSLEKVMYLTKLNKIIISPGFTRAFVDNPSYRGAFRNIDKNVEN